MWMLLFFIGDVYSQGIMTRLVSPVTYEIGIQPGFQSNPLNLSDLEIEKVGNDTDYLDGIENSSSNVVSVYGKLSYSPRLIGGRKTRISGTLFYHSYHDIPERTYQSASLSLKQSLGKYRYLLLGYGILPKYYLRNYLDKDPATLISTRQNCSFGTDRAWLGFEHRLSRKNRLEYRLTVRQEIYQAPFSRYDMSMREGALSLKSDQIKGISLAMEAQYGIADNDNQIDDADRSYRYLNFRPTLSLKFPGKHLIKFSGRYDQRAYDSEETGDPLHAGRYQEEFRLDISLSPGLSQSLVLEPFAGYRERRVDSSDAAIQDLKSFTRYWFGIRIGFKSVIDMYF